MSLLATSRGIPTEPSVGAFSMPDKAQTGSTSEGALSSLSKFIPSEILAPYAAAVSLAPQMNWSPMSVYLCFVALTPVLLLVFVLAQKASSGENWPKFPPLIWRALAASVAFSVWATVIPNNPLQAEIGGAGVAGLLAASVAPVLYAIDKIILRLLGASDEKL